MEPESRGFSENSSAVGAVEGDLRTTSDLEANVGGVHEYPEDFSRKESPEIDRRRDASQPSSLFSESPPGPVSRENLEDLEHLQNQFEKFCDQHAFSGSLDREAPIMDFIGIIDEVELRAQRRNGGRIPVEVTDSIEDFRFRIGTFLGRPASGVGAMESGRPMTSMHAVDLPNRRDVTHSAKSEAKQQLIGKLFPCGIANTVFSQGRIGNCRYSATFFLFCRHRPDLIEEMIHPGKSPDEVKIVIHGCDPVYFDLRKFHSLSARGDLGAQVIEYACAYSRKTLFSRSSEKIMQSGKFMAAWGYFAGGTSKLIRLDKSEPGSRYFSMPSRWKEIRRELDAVEAHPDKFLATVSFPEDILDSNGARLHGSHSHAILHVDGKNGRLVLGDPHDSSAQRPVSLQNALLGEARFEFFEIR